MAAPGSNGVVAERKYDMAEKTKTNADRIREMSDEELSEKMSRMAHCLYCPVRCGIFCTDDECKAEWLSWLRSPADQCG